MKGADADLVILARDADGSVQRLTAAAIDEIDRLTDRPGTLVWVSAISPRDELVEQLSREFRLHPLALEDLRRRRQRPKVDAYEAQTMIVAYEAAGSDVAAASEIHLFVGAGWILSVQWASTPMLEGVRDRFGTAGRSGVTATSGGLVYAILDAIVDSYFPELDRISERIDALEDRLLDGSADDEESLAEILRLKRTLLERRRVLAPMRDVANTLLRRDLEIVDDATMPYYQDLYDHLVRVLDQLDVYRDLLATVLDARLTVASNSLNAVMKRLTAFTVVLMVPTLIAGIYGMNFDGMPELRWPLGYPAALIGMVLAAAAAATYFRRRGWF